MARLKALSIKAAMAKRTITALLMFAIGMPLLLWGGLAYFAFIGFLLLAATWEYVTMESSLGYRSSKPLMVFLVLAVIVARVFFVAIEAMVLTVAVLLLMAYHLYQYETGHEPAAGDFSISVGILVYLGWVGSYLVLLRQLENGGWWLMLTLFCVWLTDTGAYMIGSAYGKHKMSPRLSPKKSWEGYLAGIGSATLIGGFLAFAFSQWGPLHLAIWQGALLGLLIGILTPLGDLGVSMIKRRAHFKDSGTLIPGHGGAFDRIDSWIWAAVIGTIVIRGLFL